MPGRLWVSDFTDVSTWQGFANVVFDIDTFADRIVGWRVFRSRRSQFVLDTLEQALLERRSGEGLPHHSDRGGQHLSLRDTERLPEVGPEPSVGSVGENYDTARAETIIGLFKAKVTHRLGLRKAASTVERETLRPVDWFNNRCLLGLIGNIPPTEAKNTFIDAKANLETVA